MIYIYDILLNFKNELYEFYDWYETDNIVHVRKIPLFNVSTKTINDLKNFKVKFPSSFLETILDKTEIFQNKKISSVKNSFIVSDGLEAFAILNQNNNQLVSRLLMEEELEVLDEVKKMKETNFEYKKIQKRFIQGFKTRKELSLEKYLKKELKKLEKEDLSKLQYLYYECFSKECDDRKTMLDSFYKELNNNFSSFSLKLLSFFKLVH